MKWLLYGFGFFYYREAETRDPQSGSHVSQGDSSNCFARLKVKVKLKCLILHRLIWRVGVDEK